MNIIERIIQKRKERKQLEMAIKLLETAIKLIEATKKPNHLKYPIGGTVHGKEEIVFPNGGRIEP